MKKYLLILILLVAAFLRLYRLADYPALNADEAAIGYNAYALITTGMDEHANPWPIHFQSFNDFKPGLYFYLILPFVKILGLTELAVRLPNALLGILTVYLLYFLSNDLVLREANKRGWGLLAIIAPAMLAVNPWHIHFSRGGWEVNTSTFFITLGLLLFLRSIRRINFFTFNGSLLAFLLSLYTYHSARIVTPLLFFGLATLYLNDIKKLMNVRRLVLCVFTFCILVLPLAKEILGPSGISRASGVGIFADLGPLTRINEQRGEHASFDSLGTVILHNKLVNYSLAFLDNWASHFHGEFLFLSGEEIQRNKVPETGQMYITDLVFLVLGLVLIVGQITASSKPALIILYWMLIAPIAAALTFQSPHALRSQNMVIPLTIISAFGLSQLVGWLTRQRRSLLLIGSIILLTLTFLQVTRYLRMYYLHMAKEYPFSSQYGIKELVNYVKENGKDYQKVVVTDSYDQPYILFLFYLDYPPSEFQKQHVLTGKDQYGFSTVRSFDKYEFTSFEFDSLRDNSSNTLIVGTPKEIPEYANIVERIQGLNGYEYFRIVAN